MKDRFNAIYNVHPSFEKLRKNIQFYYVKVEIFSEIKGKGD